MKAIHMLSVLVVVAAGAALLAGCGAQPAPTGAGASEASQAAAQAEPIMQKTCPVMGGAINKDIYTDYKGRRVYFCCSGCVDEFKKNPEKYLSKLDAQSAAGQKHEGGAEHGQAH